MSNPEAINEYMRDEVFLDVLKQEYESLSQVAAERPLTDEEVEERKFLEWNMLNTEIALREFELPEPSVDQWAEEIEHKRAVLKDMGGEDPYMDGQVYYAQVVQELSATDKT